MISVRARINDMEFEIDCDSKDKVFQSLSNGFACDSDQLRSILLELDIEKIYEKDWKNINIRGDEYLYEYAIRQLGNHKPLKMVNWFHLTRTTRQNDFKDGIIPLVDCLDRIWSMLIDIPTDKAIKNNLKALKNNGVPNFLYSLKHNSQLLSGPYACLVKDTAFNANDLGQHDYLRMPEIIEDICNGYEKKFGESIFEIYQSFLVPKIVKFQSSKRIDTGCVKTALYYAYEAVRSNQPSGNCVTCFDGKGSKIKPESIVSVTTVEN